MKLRYLIGCLLVLSVLLSACDGDSRAFSEAAEVQTLGLESISVIAPAETPEPIVLGTSGQLQLGLTGEGAGGDDVSLSASDRDWFSSDPEVAEVDRNGLVTAKSVGSASFQVDLGGIRSSALGITVTDAVLDTINISRVDSEGDSASVERCIAQNYRATGEDTEGNVRVLTTVDWSVNLPSDARVEVSDESNPAIAQLTVLNFVTDLKLLASDPDSGVESDELAVPVSNTLRSILIDSPSTVNLNAGETRQLKAVGTYNQLAGEQPDSDDPPGVPQAGTERDITTGVSWRVVSGSEFATVNEATGLVSAVTAGSAQIVASCGNVESTAVAITVQGTPDSNNLAFDVVGDTVSLGSDNRIVLQPDDKVRVRVSTGSTYSEDNDVTADVEWTHNNLVEPIAASLVEGSNFAEITAESIGDIQYTASYQNAEETLTVDVRR